MQGAGTPVIGHLAPAAGGIGGGADGLEKHVGGGEAERQAQGAVAIVGEEPVVAGPEGQGRANLEGFVAGAVHLEEDLLLPLEHDLAIVDPAGGIHQPVDLDHGLRIERPIRSDDLGIAQT